MQTIKHQPPKITAATFMIPYVFALVVFFFGFTDLPRMREEAFPLFCLFLVLLAIPLAVDTHKRKSNRRR